MKIKILLPVIFLSFLFYASVRYSHGIVGLTKLNGEGCVCHNTTPDPGVQVWIEGPDSVEVNHTVAYKIYLTGGPAAAGGYNAAAFSGIIFPGDSTSIRIDEELTHNSSKLFTGDTISWELAYTAPSSVQWDTIYSVAQSVNNDGIPNALDKWNFSENFPVKIIPFVPVELISFTVIQESNAVILKWSTASETNNAGFEIEKKGNGQKDWVKIAYINGNNTTTMQSNYSFTDNASVDGETQYRLKQIDFSGDYSYSETVYVSIFFPVNEFTLEQNYPNPFNPVTKIKYSIPHTHSGLNVSLRVFDITGKEVAVLVNDEKSEGIYEVEFNGASLSSGIYFYSIRAGQYSAVRKFILMK